MLTILQFLWKNFSNYSGRNYVNYGMVVVESYKTGNCHRLEFESRKCSIWKGNVVQVTQSLSWGNCEIKLFRAEIGLLVDINLLYVNWTI